MATPLPCHRRQFLQATASLGAIAMSSATLPAAEDQAQRYFKAVKIGMVRVPGTLTDKFKLLKELGFDGVELDSPGGPSAEEVAAAKEASGLIVHGVVDSAHWRQTLSDADPAIRAQGVEALKTAIKMSKAYGGTSVLLVPGVVKGDVTYEQCWERSILEIRKALPVAEEHGILILLENVWNNFLTDPKETVRYIEEIDSKWVGAYFDVGNTVKFSPPHEWVPILGKHLKKLDIKDYGQARGFGHDLLEGDVDWPQVMAELRKLDYRGWGTAEIAGGGRERLAEIARRMDKIFAS
jgi:L-ribulose-5-phosphate 3-epimerase